MRFIDQGFTLIELVIVIVIMGILAAAALPRYVDLSTEARKSTLKAMADSVTTGATLARGKALVDDISITAAKITADLDGDGIMEHLAYGYPDSVNQHTMEWIVDGMGRFTYDNSTGRYSLSGVTSCYVQYTNATLGNPPTISTVTSGC